MEDFRLRTILSYLRWLFASMLIKKVKDSHTPYPKRRGTAALRVLEGGMGVFISSFKAPG